jgi:hypothetical protein
VHRHGILFLGRFGGAEGSFKPPQWWADKGR